MKLYASPHYEQGTVYSIVCLSYRGYWNSAGRPSQKGIELDASATLDWVTRRFGHGGRDLQIVLWGQSIGAGVASIAAQQFLESTSASSNVLLQGLMLETPFLSVRHMLSALYPQKWLPYRYLWPFLWNTWDSAGAIEQIATKIRCKKPRVAILQAGRDELVPREHGIELETICKKHNIFVERHEVPGALHTEVMIRQVGSNLAASFIQKTTQSRST